MTPEELIEAAMVRAALTRRYLTGDQLREALLLREELRTQGRPATMLQILGHRFLTPPQREELLRVYEEVRREAVAAPIEGLAAPPPLPSMPSLPSLPSPPSAPSAPSAPPSVPRPATRPSAGPELEFGMESSADELAIPEFFQSSPLLQRPPEEDPDSVKAFLRISSEGLNAADFESRAEGGGELGLEPPAPAGAAAPEPEEEETASGLWRWVRGRLTGKK